MQMRSRSNNYLDKVNVIKMFCNDLDIPDYKSNQNLYENFIFENKSNREKDCELFDRINFTEDQHSISPIKITKT